MRLRTGAIALAVASTLCPAASAEREVTRRGYFLSRFQLLPPETDVVLYPMLEVEEFQGFVEGNLDLKISDDRYSVRSDTSLLYRASPARCRSDSNLPGCLVINELYASIDVVADRLTLLAGRQRPSWGSALSFHPVEPMNPAPDPTDPTFQRLGAWTTALELSSDEHVATAAWFPNVSHSALGTPAGLDAGLLGARYAYRPEGLDVSAIFFWDLENRLPQAGLSASTVLGESSFEVHGEALVHQRRKIETGTLKQGSCPISSLGIPHREEWDFTGIFGTRWDRGDGTLVNLEYMHNGDGMIEDDFDAVLETADLLTAMCPDGRLEPSDAAEDGRPQQLSSTFLRRNYAILSAVKPTFGDEGRLANLGAMATVLVGLDDMSGVVSARGVYTIEQMTLVRLGGLATFGRDRTQYGILPFHGIILLDLQTLF